MKNNNQDLTVGNIRLHLRRMIIPASIGFFCHTLYNMTDSFFANLVSTEAQAGLAFSFPIYFILLSFCIGFGQSVTANIGQALGKKRKNKASHLFIQANYLAIVIILFLWLIVIPQISHLVRYMGGLDDSLSHAIDYSSVILLGAPFFLLSTLANSVLQAVGNTRAMCNVSIFAVFLNLILNPILMFGWLGFPALGMTGLALATVISQAIGYVYLIKQLRKVEFIAYWKKSYLAPSYSHLFVLVRQAIAPTIRMLCIGGFFFLITAAVGKIDILAVAAYGIALRIEQLFLLPTIGLEIAMLSFASQNLGGNNKKRTALSYQVSLRYGLILMSIGGVTMVLAGYYLMDIFTDNDIVKQYGTHYLYVAGVIGMLYVVINISGAVFLGAHQIKNIMFISVMRLIAIPIGLLWVMDQAINFGLFGLSVNGIWFIIIISNLWAAWWLDKKCRLFLRT